VPFYSLYPMRSDGVALTFETAELADFSTALIAAQGVLEAHPSANEVIIFSGFSDAEVGRVRRRDSVALVQAASHPRDDGEARAPT
jgi:hypothetical protein